MKEMPVFIHENIEECELPAEIRLVMQDDTEGSDERRLQLALAFLDEGRIPKNERYAATLLRRSAENGCVDAMYELGMCYRWGDGGVWADPDLAIEWFEKAMALGNQKAKTIVETFGNQRQMLMLSAVAGIDRFSGAQGGYVKWYKSKMLVEGFLQQAEDGNAESQYELARQLENLDHVGPFRGNVEESVKWYERAANNGVIDAMFNLGMLYHNGKGTLAADPVKALYWMKQAGDAGDREAKGLVLEWLG